MLAQGVTFDRIAIRQRQLFFAADLFRAIGLYGGHSFLCRLCGLRLGRGVKGFL